MCTPLHGGEKDIREGARGNATVSAEGRWWDKQTGHRQKWGWTAINEEEELVMSGGQWRGRTGGPC